MIFGKSSAVFRFFIFYLFYFLFHWLSLVAQMVKNLLAMQKTQVWSLGRADRLEKTMATHSSILVWRIPLTEEPGRLQSMGSQRAGHDWATNTLTFIVALQCTAQRISFAGTCILSCWVSFLFRSPQSTKQLSVFYRRLPLVICSYVIVYMCQSQSLNSSHFPPCPLGIHTLVLYVYVSISALQVGSSIPFF